MVLHYHGEAVALWGVNEVSHQSKFHLYLTSYTMFYFPFFKFAYVYGQILLTLQICPYTYYLPTFRPNQFYRMDSTSTRSSQAALVEAEVEAQPIGLGRLRLRLRQRPSLF